SVDDVKSLIRLVAHADEPWLSTSRAVGPEIFGEALTGQTDYGICRPQDGLRRAIVLVECNNLGRGTKLTGEVENVAHRRGAKRINCLCIVPYDRQPAAGRLQRQQDRSLQLVRVLILVDEDVVETVPDIVGERGITDHLGPIEQEIIV